LGGTGGGVTAYAFRRAGAADARPVAEVTAEGFETYRAFAPAGWAPPSTEREIAQLRHLLADDSAWYLVSEVDGVVVAHVGFLPAAGAHRPVEDPALAHFRQLFVRRAHWGTGLATRLHAAAIDEATARGFAAMRLFTPAGQARARRFYEREGWMLTGEPALDQRIGFEVAEYRYALGL
jgi:GNAT superfamily N-acetyltransferase